MTASLSYLIVFFGAGIGGMLRHALNRLSLASPGTAFPWTTVFENVSGSLFIGLVAGWLAFRRDGTDQALGLFLTTGILGGYTTFSAFSLDSALLIERGQFGLAAIYVASSVTLSIVGVFMGITIVRVVS